MVRNVFFCLLILAGQAVAAQQYISIGPVVSFGHSAVTNGKMADIGLVETRFNPSFHAGIGMIYAKDEHWGMGAEVFFSKEGYKKYFTPDSGQNFEESNTAGYIRVPLRVYYFFGKFNQKVRPKVYLGPSFGFKIMDDYDLDGNAVWGQAAFDFFDLGLQAGGGVNIALGKATWLNLDLNYYQGLLDALKDNTVSNISFANGYNMHQHLRLQLGVLFGLGTKGK